MNEQAELVAETMREHRGEVSCVGPDAWEAVCSCKWDSGYVYDCISGDEVQWAHDDHVAAEVVKGLKELCGA